MYTRRLAHMRYDRESWVLEEPADWNLWQRIRDAGAEIAFVPHPTAVHFRERTSIAGRETPGDAVQAFAHDLLETAAPLLSVASHLRGADGLGAPRARPPARRPGERRLAVIDTTFPYVLSGFRYHEAAELLERRPDTVFFAARPTREPWPRPVHPLHQFPRLAGALGVTDVYAVFLNLTAGLLGLQDHPGAATCANMLPDREIAPALAAHKIRLHTTIYPGGGLVAGTDPGLLRAVGKRAATVFTNTAEALAAIPGAIRVAGVMATGFYAFRERERRRPFRLVFAADARPRKGLDTALAALAQLDERFHLHVVGPHAPVAHDRITFHGVLKPHELRSVYWGCDAFVSPVRPEGPDGLPGEAGLVDGFPTTTACEALASGCALVSANPRGEHWVLEPEEHFIEFPVGDAVALAGAVRRLEADRDLRDALARAGAARIRELMDVQNVVAAKLEAMGLAPVAATS
jgi:glycosyltransferase involved in cell wall biosynthesis